MKDKKSSYLMYWNVNKLYGWTISQKLPADNFVREKHTLNFDESFIKNYDENSGKEYIFKVDVDCPKNVHQLHNALPFLLESMKIKKCRILICILHDIEKNFIHIRTLIQVLNDGSLLRRYIE